MALEAILTELGMDRYDRNARLRPALFVLLPILLMIAVWLPALWSTMGGLLALVAGCGALFLLSRYTRQAGRRFERRMLVRNGGWTTTLRLRHSDDRIDPVTKARYHAALRRQGLELPASEEEEEGADGASADARYASAVNWLKEQTRGEEHKLLLDENVDYGFRRNLAGLKPLGLVVILVTLAIDGTLLWPGRNDPDQRWMCGAALGAALLLDFLALMAVVTAAFVEDAADAYADRLLKHCERI